MKKTYFTKLITIILAVMFLINSILPTKVVYGGDGDYLTYECEKDGQYLLGNAEEGVVILEFGNSGKADIYYYDESGKKVSPPNDGKGRVELKQGIIYYYQGSQIIEEEEDGTPVLRNATYTLLNVEKFPGLNQKLENGDGKYLSAKGVATSPKASDNASLIEQLITKLLMFIGTGIYAIVCWAIGEEFSIEKVIFNEYSNTKLGFFSGSEVNAFIENANIKEIMNDFFNFFTGITLLVYLIILVYMAIKIMLGSTAEKGSKYKQLIMYWIEGILILFLFPYIMKYSIQLNNSFVSFVGANKDQYLSEFSEQMPSMQSETEGELKDIKNTVDKVETSMKNNDKKDFMSTMYNRAMNEGWLVLAICWYVMLFQMIGFLIVYFKRVIILIFLIAVFPLVMISYAIDKVGDGKSQAFGNWVKEFMVNVFLQSFHVIAYVLIMSLICNLMGDPSENWLLILIALTFISKGDDILKAIFSLNSGAGTVKGIGATIAQAAAIKNISKGVRDVKDRLVGKNSAAAKVYNRASVLSQKAWDKASNRVQLTADRIKRDSLPDTRIVDLSNLSSKEELEKAISVHINTLLNRNSNPDDIRNSADQLTELMNQENNSDVQNILNKLAAGLSLSQRVKLDMLLRQNAATNALMLGGREVNITQKVDIILKCMQKENGKLTPQSRAILNKIADKESDLDIMKMNVKFKKENVTRTKSSNARNSNRSNSKNSRSSATRGRSVAKSRREIASAKNSIDYAMKSRGEVPSGNTKLGRVVSRAGKRAIEPTIVSNIKIIGRRKTNEKLNNEKKPWQNIESKNGSSGLETAKHGASAIYKAKDNNNKGSKKKVSNDALERALRYTMVAEDITADTVSGTTNYGKNIPEKKGISVTPKQNVVTVRERKALKEKIRESGKKPKLNDEIVGNSTAFKINKSSNKNSASRATAQTQKQPTNGNTKQNLGADIANRAGSAESLMGIISGVENQAFAEAILNNAINSRTKIDYTENLEGKIVVKNMPSADGKGLQGYIDKEIMKNSAYSKETKRDFKDAVYSIAVLKSTEDGGFSAKQILDAIGSLKEKITKYENGNVDERTGLEKIVDMLGCKLEDFEALVRVKILNDPDSVDNDRQIIEESKKYIKTEDIPGFIKNSLAYNVYNLKRGTDLRYVKKKNTEENSIISESQKERNQERYKQELERYELDKRIAKREADDNDKYSWKELRKDAKGIISALGETVLDSTVTAGTVGVGFVTTGLTTDGKKETLTQATTNLFTGVTMANDIYANTKNSILGTWNDTKERFKDDIPSSDSKSGNETTFVHPSKNKEYLRDKTEIKTKLFSERNNEKKD